MDSRYEGRPLVRLLECYILSAIGELSADHAANLETMTPKLRQIYKAEGTWRDIIAQVMELPPELDEQLRTLWSRNQQIAADNGEELIPEHFAQMIVDENYDK